MKTVPILWRKYIRHKNLSISQDFIHMGGADEDIQTGIKKVNAAFVQLYKVEENIYKSRQN